MAKYKDREREQGRDRGGRATATKPQARNDAYTMMLFITFAALVAGCVLLYMDHDEYGKTPAPAQSKIEIQKLGDPSKSSTDTTGDTKTDPKTDPKTKTDN